MHVHELNPWRTLIALSVFIVILIVGFLTMHKPLLKYEVDMKQSMEELKKPDACFSPLELNEFLNKKNQNVVLFDIRDNFTFGQGHIPGAENISANELTQEKNIKRLEDLKENGTTVVLYGEDQLQANGPWMLFRQVGFDNVKILLGGYQYYIQHKDNLADKTESDFKKGVPRYNFAEIASRNNNTQVNSETAAKKSVVVRRKKKAVAAAGGC